MIGLAVDDIKNMQEVLVRDSLFLLGRHSGWSDAQLAAFKTKTSSIVSC